MGAQAGCVATCAELGKWGQVLGTQMGSATAASTPVLRVQWKGHPCCQASEAGRGRGRGLRLEPLSRWAGVGSEVRASGFGLFPFRMLAPPPSFLPPAFTVRSCKNDHILCTLL